VEAGPPAEPTLQDEYEPLGDVPASGGITQITFNNGAYFLKRTVDPTADEILASESGTYALDVGAGTLTLTPTGGMAQTHSFQVQLSGSSSSLSTSGFRTFGLGDIVNYVMSFFMDGQLFHTDSPATPNMGAADDAGWPIEDADTNETSMAEGGCSIPSDAGPPVSNGSGIDVSHYQGGVNWTLVKTGRNFGFAKATEGTSYTDSAFATNFAGMKTAGVQRGAYHFFRASKDPVAQADYFAGVLEANGYNARYDLAPMLDVEILDGVSAATAVAAVQAFLNEAEPKIGATMFIYTGPSFWTHQMGNPNFSSHPLWIAHYTTAAQPTIPSSWNSYTLWQYTQSDKVSGVGTAVDGDRWAGASTMASDAGMISTCGDGGDAGLIPGTCTHDVCTAGTALGQACTSCTMIVCANDPYCCDTYWGLSCFPDVQKYCGMTCP
jgi:lysozyme